MEQALSRRRPERTAWIVVWTAFIVFCLLVVFVPLSIRHILLYSMRSHTATLQALEGTVVIENPATGHQNVVSNGASANVTEGSAITLDDKASADLRFFDGSSVSIKPGSQVVLERVQSPRFQWGVQPNMIWLRMVTGQAKIVTNSAGKTGLDFELRLKHLNAVLQIKSDGVYGAEVQTDSATLLVHQGSAVVNANSNSVQLVAPERTTVALGQPPTAPVADARELLTNGDFSQGLGEAWTAYNDQGNDGGDVPGVWSCDDETHTVRFYRTDSQHNHCETTIEQDINRDLPDPVSSLVVRANIKIVNQNLSGGGYLASEYPLMIRIKYRDKYGSENEWIQGFYYDNSQNNPTTNGLQIPRDTWYYFESENLLDTLNPTPTRIISIRVSASGWDYESMIRYISLAVQ